MILLDYKDRRPLYEQVEERLKELMVCGVLEQDSQLPSVRSLAMELSINPNTIQRAYAKLEQYGFIYSVKGKGSFVADSGSIRKLRVGQLKEELKGWIDEAKKAGVTKKEGTGWFAAGWKEENCREEEEEKSDSSRKSNETV